jgi:hypothetical protein
MVPHFSDFTMARRQVKTSDIPGLLSRRATISRQTAAKVIKVLTQNEKEDSLHLLATVK